MASRYAGIDSRARCGVVISGCLGGFPAAVVPRLDTRFAWQFGPAIELECPRCYLAAATRARAGLSPNATSRL